MTIVSMIVAMLFCLFATGVTVSIALSLNGLDHQGTPKRSSAIRRTLKAMRFTDRNSQKIKKYAYVFGAHDADVRDLVAVGDKAAREIGELDFDIIFCEALVKSEAAEQWGYGTSPMYYDEARSTTSRVSHYVKRTVAKSQLIIRQFTVSLIRTGGEENGKEGHEAI